MHVFATGNGVAPGSSALQHGASDGLLRKVVSRIGAPASRLLILFLGTFLTALLCLRLTVQGETFLLLWPVSGLVVGLALPTWRSGWKSRLALQAVAAGGTFWGGLVAGQSVLQVAPWAFIVTLDLLIAGSLLGPYVSSFEDLKKRANIARFVTAAAGAPLLSGAAVVLRSTLVHPTLWLHTTWLPAAGTFVLADSLGIAVVLPAVLFATTGEYRGLRKIAPHLRSAAGAYFFFLFVTTVIFWQSTGPFLFVIFPPMMLVLLLLGLEGAVFCSLALNAIGWFCTAHGHGPIWLLRDNVPEIRIMVLQVFSWLCMATAMPVGALLDERRRAERRVNEAQAVHQLLLENAQDAIVLSAVDGTRRYVSAAIEQLTGWTPAEYLRFERWETVHPEDRDLVTLMSESLLNGKREHAIRFRLGQKAGGWRWVEATVRGYGQEQVLGYVGTIRDISAQWRAERAWQEERLALAQENRQMADLAGTDPLTGLLNRRGLEEGVRRHELLGYQDLAVLMIDVDFFKQFNDFHGHGAGDRCLTQLGQAIRGQASRQGDLVARFGGEEFTVVLPGADAQAGLALGEAICRDLQVLAIEHAKSPLGFVSVSIGIAAGSAREGDLNLLLTQADRALYNSKHAGRNRCSLYAATSAVSLPQQPGMEVLVAANM